MDPAAIKSLIASSELEAAARQLAEGLADSPALQRVAVQLQERLHRLQQKETKGIISEEDANLERNRISDALLRLSEQLALPAGKRRWADEASEDTMAGRKRLPWLIGGGLLLAALAVWGVMNLQDRARPFDLTVYLDGLEKGSEGAVQVAFGAYRPQPKPVHADGEVVFQEIPGQYRADSIQFELIDLPYRTVSQSHRTAAESDKVTLVVEPLPTIWKGRVEGRDGRVVPDATVEVDGQFETLSDAQGRFQFEIPRRAGSRIQVRVIVKGRPVLNQRMTISEQEPAVLQLND